MSFIAQTSRQSGIATATETAAVSVSGANPWTMDEHLSCELELEQCADRLPPEGAQS